MTWRFGMQTGHTGLDELLNVETKLRPGVFVSDEFERLVLAEVTSRNMIMLFLKDSES